MYFALQSSRGGSVGMGSWCSRVNFVETLRGALARSWRKGATAVPVDIWRQLCVVNYVAEAEGQDEEDPDTTA